MHLSPVQISAVQSFLFFKVLFFNTFWKLELGLGLDLGLQFLEIFMENSNNVFVILREYIQFLSFVSSFIGLWLLSSRVNLSVILFFHPL